jgi:transposase
MIEGILAGVAAIDIGQDKLHVAAGGLPADEPSVRVFGTFTCDLELLAKYLAQHEVRRVAMEATGVLWVPVYDTLQAAGFEVTLFNGLHARNLPGRKTDVQDCQWHAMLHGHGLLKPSFVPPAQILELRSYHRLREDHISLAASHVQHMRKALDLMNVRLANVISDIHLGSGLKVVEAILDGERDPERLAALCSKQILNKKRSQVLRSLQGTWQEHHLFALRQALHAHQFYQSQIAECDREIARLLEEWTQDQVPREPGPEDKSKRLRRNAPQIPNLHTRMLTLCDGRDPTQISGIGLSSHLKLVSELGTDLSAWPTRKRFISWLGLGAGRHDSGKSRRRVRQPKTVAGQIFREAAMGLTRSTETALGAFYRRVKGARGHAIAIKALARKLAEYYYDVMTKGLHHVEIGLERYADMMRERKEHYLRKTAHSLGFQLVSLDTGEVVH